MKKIWQELKKKKPVIVLAVSRADDESLADDSVLSSTDLIEFRADLNPAYPDKGILKEELKKLSSLEKPLLLTVRSPSEGGQADKNENKRLELYRELLPFAELADIEISSAKALKEISREFPQKGIIGSFHDFKSTPSAESLSITFQNGRKLGADLIKFACMPLTDQDITDLLKFCIGKSDELISVMSMGEAGALSRVFFPVAGSLLTYTFSGTPTAPGQMNLEKLSQLISDFYPSKG